MSTYVPDKWALAVVDFDGETYYRVLGSWYGGYTTGDSWKLSSGVLENQITIDEDGSFVSPQSSGSCYILGQSNYGMSGYTANIANNFVREAEDSKGYLKFTVLSENDAKTLLLGMVK